MSIPVAETRRQKLTAVDFVRSVITVVVPVTTPRQGDTSLVVACKLSAGAFC